MKEDCFMIYEIDEDASVTDDVAELVTYSDLFPVEIINAFSFRK
jgi:hypothetical protein